jgi:hypothetical protein
MFFGEGVLMATIELLIYDSAFDRKRCRAEQVPYRGESLAILLQRHLPRDIRWQVSISGQRVDPGAQRRIRPKSNSQVVCVPQVGDPVSAVAGLMSLFGGAIGGIAGVVGGVLGGEMLWNIGVALAGGWLVKALSPEPPDALPAGEGGAFSYAPQTMQRQGLVQPVVIGRTKVYANIIAAHTSVVDYRLRIHFLAHLCTGPVQSISDVVINDQPVGNYGSASVVGRTGSLDQTALPAFNPLKIETRPNVQVTQDGGPVTYAVPGNDYDGLEIVIGHPKGVWYIHKSGGASAITAMYAIEIAERGTGNWETLTDYGTRAWKKTQIFAEYTNTGSYTGGSPVTITRGKRYDIRITKKSGDSCNTRICQDTYLAMIRRLYTDGFRYPRQALVAVSDIDAQQLSGGLRFSAIVDGLLRTYDGASWSIEHSDNLAWAAYHVLSQPIINTALTDVERYDGLDPSRISTDDFYEWAQYCAGSVSDGDGGTEARLTFNGVIESESNIWETFLRMCQMGRAMPYWEGNMLRLAIDKSVATPVHKFDMADIRLHSFRETFLPQSERASEIEIGYRDRDQDYELTKLTIVNSDITNFTNTVSLDYIGIDHQALAYRVGAFELDKNAKLNRLVEFDADIDAIRCVLGDVVYLQHDLPNPGQVASGTDVATASGRIKNAYQDGSDDRIVLHWSIQPFLTAGTTYEIMVQLSNDTIETKTIQTVVGAAVTVSGKFSGTLSAGDRWTIGQQNILVKQFRIVSISKQSDQRRHLKLIEYDSTLWDSDSGEPVLAMAKDVAVHSDQKLLQPPNWDQLEQTAPEGAFTRGIFRQETPPDHDDGRIWQDTSQNIYTILLLAFNGSDEDTFTRDLSKDNHNAAFRGDAQLDASQKKFGDTSLRLQGSSDYLSIADHSDFDLADSDFTVDLWMRLKNLPADGDEDGLVCCGDAFWTAVRNSGGTYTLYFRCKHTDSTVYQGSSDSVSLQADTWYHVAFVRSGNTLTFYLDGTAAGTVDLTGVTIADSGNPVEIGYEQESTYGQITYFDGWLDEVRVCNGIAQWTDAFDVPTRAYSSSYYMSLDDEWVAISAPSLIGQPDIQAHLITNEVWETDSSPVSLAYCGGDENTWTEVLTAEIVTDDNEVQIEYNGSYGDDVNDQWYRFSLFRAINFVWTEVGDFGTGKLTNIASHPGGYSVTLKRKDSPGKGTHNYRIYGQVGTGSGEVANNALRLKEVKN